jgi:hypothetical protein
VDEGVVGRRGVVVDVGNREAVIDESVERSKGNSGTCSKLNIRTAD